MKRRVANLVIALVVSSILAACGNHSQADVNDKNISTEATKAVEITETPESIPTEAAEPTSVPTETPTPTIEPTVAPTLEPTATPTPEPTATPEPTVTPTMEPTATPEPTVTPTMEPTATPEPTSTPTPTATPKPTSTSTLKPTATPTPTATPDPTPTPHVHSYSSTVTTEANCQHSGEKLFTCSCGDTYTESIPQGTHNLEFVGGTQHDANKCRCGYIFTCDADYDEHQGHGGWTTTTVIDSVDHWHCTVCGYEEELGW